MGGQSFECPLKCGKWVLSKRALKDHLKDAHGMVRVCLTDGPHPEIITADCAGKWERPPLRDLPHRSTKP